MLWCCHLHKHTFVKRYTALFTPGDILWVRGVLGYVGWAFLKSEQKVAWGQLGEGSLSTLLRLQVFP
jgi:hypothetical protein